MDTKISIAADSIAWTLSKPVMLAVAVVGGMSVHSLPTSPQRTPGATSPVPPVPRSAAPAPGFSLLAAPGGNEALSLAALATPDRDIPRARLVNLEASARPASVATLPARTLPPAGEQPAPDGMTQPSLQYPAAQYPATAPQPALIAPAGPISPPGGARSDLLPAVARISEEMIRASAPAIPPAGDMDQAIAQVALVSPADLPAAMPLGSGPAVSPSPIAAGQDLQFVSNPLVQQVPVSAEAKADLAPVRAQPVAAAPARPVIAPAAAAAPRAPSAPRPAPAQLAREPQAQNAAAFTPARKTKMLASIPAGASRAHAAANGTIELTLAASVNGQVTGSLPLRVTPDDRLWLRLGDLLGLVGKRMPPAEFARLSAAAASNEYVEFAAVRQAGIGLRYDAARNQISLDAE